MKQALIQAVRNLTRRFGVDIVRYREVPQDFDPLSARIWQTVRPYTMTQCERVFTLVQAVRYLEQVKLGGAFVECGVWRGGSAMAMALSLMESEAPGRDLHLFDTFEGMSAPTDKDVDFNGVSSAGRFKKEKLSNGASAWCRAPMDDVKRNMASTGYPQDRIHYIQGKVEDTLPVRAPESIALLRLDTDWYESTRHEMQHLFPRLVPGGVLILDDYGHWQGARQAVDEYLEQNGITLLLNRVDYSGRIALKPA